jgi:hypothetical protein
MYSVSRLCRLLEASRTGFIALLSLGPSKREPGNEALLEDIKKCHLMSNGTYGSDRTSDELCISGIPCSENRVARLMKDAGICGVVRRKYRQTPLDTNAASYLDRFEKLNLRPQPITVAALPSCIKKWHCIHATGLYPGCATSPANDRKKRYNVISPRLLHSMKVSRIDLIGLGNQSTIPY